MPGRSISSRATSVRGLHVRYNYPCLGNTKIIGYIPASYGHYVENIGNTTLRYLEIFKADIFKGKVLFCTGGGSGICKGMTEAVVRPLPLLPPRSPRAERPARRCGTARTP